MTIFSFNTDGSDMKTVKIPEADNEGHGYMTFTPEGEMYCTLNIYNWEDEDYGEGEMHIMETDEAGASNSADETSEDKAVVDADPEAPAETGDSDAETIIVDNDSAEAIDHEYVDESVDEQQYLVKYDAMGNEIFRIDLLEDIDRDNDFFSVFGMVYDDKEGLVISSNKGISKLDENSKSLKMIIDNSSNESGNYYQDSMSIYRGFQGQIFVSKWGENGMEFMSFDPSTGSFGEKSSQFTTYDDFTFFGGNGYDIYVAKRDGIYGVDYSKDTLTKILDYMDSDLSVSYSLSTVVAISDNEFIANIPDEENNYELVRLKKVPADQVKDRTVITLGGYYVDYRIRQKVYKFNNDNQDYKIKIIDYSTLNNSEDQEAGLNQFNLDIVSGNIPDIMYFSTEEPVDSYINKGLFLDLLPFIKNDPELSGTEFVDNVFEAFKTGDKVYQIVPSFIIDTVSTKSSYLKGSEVLSLDDAKEMIEAKGIRYMDSFGMITKQEVMYVGMMAAGNGFIDWENRRCNFDSEEFIKFIEFANNFPETLPDDAWQDFKDTCFMEGDALFSTTYLNGFRSYRRYVDGTFGDEITLIGFPNNMGRNCSVLIPTQRLCVSSKTKNAEVCWELVRQLLLEDYQDELEYEFPIRKSSYDKLAAAAMERQFWIDDDGTKHFEDDSYYVGDQQIVIKPLTREDVEYVKQFIGSLDNRNTYNANKNVYNIVNEEVAAYFSGQKTSKEVADIIQSRVSIYVNENS
jgi:ABC-type glycerol-3-phosphate transport system substrate-binding protein